MTHLYEFYFQEPHAVFMIKTGEKKELDFHYLDREEKKTNSLEMYPEKVTIFKNIHTKGCFFPQNKLFYQTEPYQTWGKGKEQLDNWNLF